MAATAPNLGATWKAKTAGAYYSGSKRNPGKKQEKIEAYKPLNDGDQGLISRWEEALAMDGKPQ